MITSKLTLLSSYLYMNILEVKVKAAERYEQKDYRFFLF